MKIYIAGPYGDNNPKHVIAENVRRADEIARAVAKLGHVPFCPHKMTWHWEDDKELSYEDFLRIDMEWLKHCDAIFFIGPSNGALKELEFAKSLGLKVFTRMEEVTKV